MKLVIIFGDAAVGKMTVGQELCKITDLRLFHNHMTIEPVIEIFGRYDGDVIRKLREAVFEEYSKSDNYGLVFTFMWAFDMKEDWDYIAHVSDMFRSRGADVYYVELVADMQTRLARNKSENRLANKPSKRDLDLSDQRLISDSKKYRLQSFDGEIPFENYVKIDNTDMSPQTVAEMIKNKFSL